MSCNGRKSTFRYLRANQVGLKPTQMEPNSEIGGETYCRSRGHKFDLGRSHTLVEIDHKIFPTVILLLPLIQEGLLSVTKRKYVHEMLVIHLVKLAQVKVWSD